jgi:hypothetical protein
VPANSTSLLRTATSAFRPRKRPTGKGAANVGESRAFLRADSVARAQLYKVLAENGLRTRNELRALDNEPPLPGGDDLTVQVNLLPIQLLGQVAKVPAEKPIDPAFSDRSQKSTETCGCASGPIEEPRSP